MEVVAGDLDGHGSLDRAVEGVRGVSSVHAGAYEGGPYGDDPEHEARSAAKLGAACVAAGVAHLVHSSAFGIDTPLESKLPVLKTKLPVLKTKSAAEAALRETGLSLTFLRPSSFMEHTFDSLPPRTPERQADHPAAGRESGAAHRPVDDIAALAFAAPERHRGKAYTLAGDDMNQVGRAALTSRVTGRKAPYAEVPIERPRGISMSSAATIAVLNENPLSVDIDALGEIHPGLLTFEDWLHGVGKPLVEAYFARVDAKG